MCFAIAIVRARRPRPPKRKEGEANMRILFVCTGNICRSPTAERLAQALCEERGISGCSFSSGGTRAVVGHPIHAEAAKVVSELGGDPSSFSAQRFTPRLAARADLILTMTLDHRRQVLETVPSRLRQTFTLQECALLVFEHGARTIGDLSAKRSCVPARSLIDIPDPIGCSREVFARVGEEIARLVPAVLQVCQ